MNEQAPWQGRIEVPGRAYGMGSKRIGRAGGKPDGKPILIDDNDKGLRGWQRLLKAAMGHVRPLSPLDCPVQIEITVFCKRPKAHFGKGKNALVLRPGAPLAPTEGRDIDKIARAVLDAGTGTWWKDDSRVTDLHIRRFYADAQGERTLVIAAAAPPVSDRPHP